MPPLFVATRRIASRLTAAGSATREVHTSPPSHAPASPLSLAVVGQKDLHNFREVPPLLSFVPAPSVTLPCCSRCRLWQELGKKIDDSYSVVLKSKTLPLGLLSDHKKRARASLLEALTLTLQYLPNANPNTNPNTDLNPHNLSPRPSPELLPPTLTIACWFTSPRLPLPSPRTPPASDPPSHAPAPFTSGHTS
jgi:hypothetical protein